MSCSRFINAKRNGLTFTAVLAATMALHTPAHAQGAPEITPSLKKLLGGLPVEGIKDELQGMVKTLKKTTCGNNLTGCYMTQSGPLQLYFFTSGTSQQTLLLVVDKSMKMPRLLGEKAQKVMGETSLSAPIISISTTDYALDNIRMPAALQKVVRENYFNVNSLEFSSGVQLAARASLGGPIKLAMQSMGVDTSQLTMRAAVVMPIPTDLAGGAGAGVGAADAVAHGDTMKKAGADALKPEAFVELQFAPKAVLDLKLPKVTLTDATFFLNNSLTFGYKGNAAFKGAEDKKVIMHFQTPLNPAGAMDLLDFTFRMATPASFTMEDGAHMMVAMAVPDNRLAQYGGGFIRNIDAFKGPLLAMTKPLSVVKLQNPVPPPPYVFGDSTKPFPDDEKYFNFALLGPLADGGPLLKAAGDVRILGQKMGWLFAEAGRSGLNGDVGEQITLKLGPLGKVKFKMQATMAINANKQDINLLGNFAGQKVAVGMSGSTMKVEVSASCVNPFEIKTALEIKPSTDIAEVFDGQGGVNVDPSKIGGCIGKELEAAYRKISGEFSHLGGYTAAAANAELNKIANAAAAEAQRVAKAAEDEAQKTAKAAEEEAQRAAREAEKAANAARKEYDKAKNAARDVASKTSNAANQAFNDAGNAFKRIGKKKKHKKGPDPKFAASVFDWDYYYDNAPDVVKAKVDLATHWRDSGFNEGRQGSPEFSSAFYWSRYLDVQSLCNRGDRACSLQHWLDYGIRQGRQGSEGFSVASYLDRYSDLRRVYGADNFEDALDHWFTNGEDEGRDAKPAAVAAGPLAGSRQIGGGGGGAWTDVNTCAGQYLTGWRLNFGKTVDRTQFRYSNGAWAPVQGGKKGFNSDITLRSGEYVVRVDYRSGSRIDSLSFTTNQGRKFGPYGGGGGSPGTYNVTAGEKLGCVSGRSGGSTDQLTFTSTGIR